MKLRKFVLITVWILLGGLCTSAKEFWEQPFEKWNRKQVNAILNGSPWAHDQTLAVPVGGKDAGIQGEKEIFATFTVRFFSAQPVREAYVRMMQIMNKYDEMTADQREAFRARTSRALKLDVSDRVIVAVEFASNLPQMNRDMKQFFDTARTDTLKQRVYLISQRLGRVELREYFPPSPDGTGAKFIFPRQVNGTAVVQPEDKEVNFEFYVSVVNQKLLVNFRVDKMLYRDGLSY